MLKPKGFGFGAVRQPVKKQRMYYCVESARKYGAICAFIFMACIPRTGRGATGYTTGLSQRPAGSFFFMIVLTPRPPIFWRFFTAMGERYETVFGSIVHGVPGGFGRSKRRHMYCAGQSVYIYNRAGPGSMLSRSVMWGRDDRRTVCQRCLYVMRWVYGLQFNRMGRRAGGL